MIGKEHCLSFIGQCKHVYEINCINLMYYTKRVVLKLCLIKMKLDFFFFF